MLGQVVISGEKTAVEKGIELLNEKGARKIILLNTSGPFHTNKLEMAKLEFEKELENIKIKKGNIPVIKNIDGMPYQEQDNVKEILAKHMVSPVRFDKTIEYMAREQIDNYIEIGPGRTLTGFVKKANKNVNIINVNDLSSLEAIL